MRPYLVFAAVALAACGGPARPAQTTVTAADVAEPIPPPATREAEPEAKPEPPPGELACRTHTDGGEVDELWIEMKGNEGMGTVVRVVPSGMVHRQRVSVERNEKVVLADDLHEVDLVKHAAMVAKKDGKTYMRVGDSPWRACE